MNNKMAVNIYLSTIESKKQTKQRRTQTVQEMEQSKNYTHDTWTWTIVWEFLREWVVLGGGGQKGKNSDNCNSIINKIFLIKELIGKEGPGSLFPFCLYSGCLDLCPPCENKRPPALRKAVSHYLQVHEIPSVCSVMLHRM